MKFKKFIYASIIVTVAIVLAVVFFFRISAVKYLNDAVKTQNLLSKIELLNKAISIRDNFERAYIERANTYLRMVYDDYMRIYTFVKYDTKLSTLQKFYINQAKYDLNHISREKSYPIMGKIYLFEKKFQKSALQFEKAIAEGMQSFDVNILGALSYIGSKHYNRAIEILEKAVELTDIGEHKARAFELTGNTYVSKKNRKSALDNYRKAFDTGTQNLNLIHNLAYSFVIAKDWSYAKHAIEKLIIDDYYKPVGYFLYAVYFWNKDNDIDKTLEYLEKAKSASEKSEVKDLFSPDYFPGLEREPNLQKYFE